VVSVREGPRSQVGHNRQLLTKCSCSLVTLMTRIARCRTVAGAPGSSTSSTAAESLMSATGDHLLEPVTEVEAIDIDARPRH
jgi:hypothetical protein